MGVEKVKIVLVGSSGYGHFYLSEIFKQKRNDFYLVGVVDINPKKSDYYDEIVKRNIPIYTSLDAFYKDHQADLAIISTPIHLHKEQACLAMTSGSHVLCEKPLTADRVDIEEMINVRNKAGKFLAVGFNWSFAPSTQQLKVDILNGRFGKAKRAKSLVLWSRNDEYYQRTTWAGKQYSPAGQLVLDSVANNAAAHFLHHLLYSTGDSLDRSAELDYLTAELYKANKIETFDTCAVHLKTKTNVDVLYIASHAVKESTQPHFVLEFEHGTISYLSDNGTSEVVAVMNDGSEVIYQDPEKDFIEKLYVCIDAILEDNHDILCGIEAATPHVQSIEAMHKSVPNVPSFPQSLTKREEELKLTWIDGLGDTLIECYEKWSLPSDLEIPWSQKGKTINVN